jgi:hypothetical protein
VDAVNFFVSNVEDLFIVRPAFLVCTLPVCECRKLSKTLLQFMEPGSRYACLVRKEWNTHEQVNLGVSGTTLSLRAFQGDYDVVVRRGGVPVQQQTFHLGTQPLTWTLAVTDSTGQSEEKNIAISLSLVVQALTICVS